MVKKTVNSPKETRVKILLEHSDFHPQQPSTPILTKPLTIPAVIPKVTPLPKEVKTAPAPVQRVPASVPVPTPVQRTVLEVPSTPAPKAPPPPPPVKEEYKYPHKSSVESILKQNIKCTKNMNRLKLRGTVVLSFDLSQNGEILHIQINESSGSEILDSSVEQQIKSISPAFPKPEETVTFKKVPFEFKQCK